MELEKCNSVEVSVIRRREIGTRNETESMKSPLGSRRSEKNSSLGSQKLRGIELIKFRSS